MSIATYLSKVVSYGILYIMGWSPLTESSIMRIKEHKRNVFIFSHTSYWDFYIFILYRLAYPEYFSELYTLVKPQPFRYAGWLLRRLGAIPSSRLEDKGGGGVQRIINYLKDKESFIFLMSPKGTIVRKPWRSGYLHIAKETNSTIRVVGLDYNDHCVRISRGYDKVCDIDTPQAEQELQQYLQTTVCRIVPLHPDQEVAEIAAYYATAPTVCNTSIECLSVLTTVIGLCAMLMYCV